MSRRSRPIALAATITLSLFGAQLAAQSNKAVAQSLFDEGRALVKAGKAAEACPKLEESQRLDPTLNTEYFVADCWELSGRTASAWAEFLEVASKAKAAGEEAKAKKAKERADALAPKLARLRIRADEASADVEIRRDGERLGPGQLGAAIAVDPGEHVVSARAPGKAPFEQKIHVKDPGATLEVVIPKLADAAAPVASTAPTSASSTVTTAPSSAPPVASSSPAPVASAPVAPRPVNRDERSTSRVPGWAWAGFGVGGVGLVVGGITGVVAASKASSVKSGCPNQQCPPDMHDTLDATHRWGTVSTIGFAVAGVGAIVGVTGLLLGSPSANEAKAASVDVWIGAGSVGVRGSF